MARDPLLTQPFLLCALANLAQGTAFNLFLHVPRFLNEIGAGDVEIGVLFGVSAVVGIAARPPIGPLMDLRGRRGVILAGGALNTLVCALYLGIHAMGPAIYALRMLHGVSEALLFTALFTYAADQVPASRRTEGLALFGVSGMLPIALGGLLGEHLLRATGFPGLFAVAALLAAVSLLLSLPLRDAPAGDVRAGASRGFRASLVQRDLLPLWWIGGMFALALSSAFVFIRRFVDETGIGSVGDFFAAYAGAAVVVRVVGGSLPDRVGPKRVLLPALAALAAGLACLGAASDARDVVLAGLLCGVGHGYVFPVVFALVVSRAGDADRGSASAIYTSLFDVGVVLGGPLFGGLAAGLGFGWAYGVAAGVIALGAVVFVGWDRRALMPATPA